MKNARCCHLSSRLRSHFKVKVRLIHLSVRSISPILTMSFPGASVSYGHISSLTNQDENVNFVRGSPNNYFCTFILKSDHWLFFSVFFQSVAMATRALHEFQFFLAILRKDHPRNIPVKFDWNLPSGENCGRTDDGHSSILISHPPVVRWDKNFIFYQNVDQKSMTIWVIVQRLYYIII